MSKVNNTKPSFKLNDTFAVVIPVILILATAIFSPFITLALFIIWGVVTYFSGVKVTNRKTGQEEVMHDFATSAFGMKHQAKDLYVDIKHTSLKVAATFNHQQEMRDLKLQLLGTTMGEQDTIRNEARAAKEAELAIKFEIFKAGKLAIVAEFRATYLVD